MQVSNDEDKTFQKLAGYPIYMELLAPGWKKVAESDRQWWENMCSDFPDAHEFYRRLAIAETY